MRVAVLPADADACGMYRILAPAYSLIAGGADIDIRWAGNGEIRIAGTMGRDGHVQGVEDPGADVIVIQRPLYRQLYETIPFFQARGVRVVIELDDDYKALPSTNTAYQFSHPSKHQDRSWRWLQASCAAADAVVCTTPALVERYGHGHGVVVPNFVPAKYLQCSAPPNDPLVVGWAGNMEVHTGDLAVVGSGCRIAMQNTDARFRLIGVESQLEQVQHELRLVMPPESTGWFTLEDYPMGIAELDVGIVPLADNQFNAGKSFLKGLEYASTKVPFVASGTEPYRTLAQKGAGVIASKPKDWARALGQLIRDAEYRAEVTGRGYAAAQQLTIEGNAQQFWDAWTGCAV